MDRVTEITTREKTAMHIKFILCWTTLFVLAIPTAVGSIDSHGEDSTAVRSDVLTRFSLDIVPKEVEPGGVVKVEIRGPGEEMTSAEGSLGDQELIFQKPQESPGIYSIAGIDLDRTPGRIPITVLVRKRDGGADIIRDEVTVSERTFGVQRLTIEEKPYTPELLERIDREADRFRALWESVTPERYWREAFARPLSAITVTSEFGLRRFINEVPRRPHTGVDLRAAAGDTIYATNDGVVVLSGDFYFNGKSIVLDHGEGLYSMYFHLSEYIAGKDDRVWRGEPIGLVGSTGRSTAPHLHWGIILRGARLDPFKILELPI
jgi:murein DD-endopeptidase MepM/ murein hydrolase activator NlpD